ncbi:small, acid-soluble spore protein, alpha/beta type [Bacillus swezeyi]
MISMARSNNNNELLIPNAQQAIEQMKLEIAQEFGVQLGAETTSRANGSVGGEITKRLVQMAQQQMGGQFH